MTVKLISHTRMIDYGLNLTEQIAYIARVSNPANQNSTMTSDKLVKYLIDHKHWSPFEMVNVCLEIVTTRDIARQMLRHRSFFFQEFSQRYADPTKSLRLVTKDARMQDTKNRQNSKPTQDETLTREWEKIQETVISQSLSAYNWAMAKGLAKEVARVVLPEGLTQSRIYMSGTIRSWMHYIQLRSDNGTQLEHRLIAEECATVISSVFPQILDFVKKEKE